MTKQDDMTLWRQDLQLLWARCLSLDPTEQEWLVQDFVRRAEQNPERLAGLLELAGQDLARLESLGWLEGELERNAASESEADLPALESLNLPETELRQHREVLKFLFMTAQARLDALWLEGAQA